MNRKEVAVMHKTKRVGMENTNKYGSKIMIIKYKHAKDIDILFIDYNYIKNTRWSHFSEGNVKSPYCKTVYSTGYIGEGEYAVSVNGKATKQYNIWHHMIRRVYGMGDKKSTYSNCTVCAEWHNFQNFARWYDENYYEINEEKLELDKDILEKGNRTYSPETCVFAPKTVNNMFHDSYSARGDLPVGVTSSSPRGLRTKKYTAKIVKNKCCIFLGDFYTKVDAFETYKVEKEKHIKEIANQYKCKIPQNLYNALCEYEVEMTD